MLILQRERKSIKENCLERMDLSITMWWTSRWRPAKESNHVDLTPAGERDHSDSEKSAGPPQLTVRGRQFFMGRLEEPSWVFAPSSKRAGSSCWARNILLPREQWVRSNLSFRGISSAILCVLGACLVKWWKKLSFLPHCTQRTSRRLLQVLPNELCYSSCLS